MSAKASEPAPRSRGRSVISGRPGPVRAHVVELLRVARDAGGMSPILELRGEFAVRYAALVDSSTARGDAGAMIRSMERLAAALDRPPFAQAPVPSSGGDSSDSTGDDPRTGLLLVMDGPPKVGHAADA